VLATMLANFTRGATSVVYRPPHLVCMDTNRRLRRILTHIRTYLRTWLHGRPDEFLDENGDDRSAW
jgi:transposase